MTGSIEVEDKASEDNDNLSNDSLFDSNIPIPLASSGDDNDSESSIEDENSLSNDEDGEKVIDSASDSETETEDEDEVLTPLIKVKWKKGVIGEHTPLVYEGPISQDTNINTKKNGIANTDFFAENPDPVQCFFAFLPISFFDNVAEWTEKKLNDKKITGYEEARIQRNEILGMIALWFIFGLVSLPSTDMYYNVGIPNILLLLNIEVRDAQNLPKILMYNQLASSVH